MGILIKNILNAATIQILTLNSDPDMIKQENVAHAAKELVKTIKLLELYPSLQSLVEQFEFIQTNSNSSIHTHRTSYIWKLSQATYQLTSLNVPDIYFLQSNSLKCQFAFLNILLDDICDLGHDRTIFDDAVLALNGKIYRDDSGLYQLIATTWAALQSAMEKTPNYMLLKSNLEEAYQKWLASFEYSLWLKDSSRLDEPWERHLEIISHSGTIYFAGLIDLLFIPNLLTHQISYMLDIFLCTQKMGQIANWLTTWPRELPQQDFTSGIFTLALEKRWITWNDLKNGDIEKVSQKIRSSPIESLLWHEWERLRVESHQIAQTARLPALDGYIESFSLIMYMLLASTGLL